MTDEEADALAVERIQHLLIPSAIPGWIRRRVHGFNARPIDLIKDGKIDEVVRKLNEWLQYQPS